MSTPNILLHYWTEKGQNSTFQDILQQELPSQVLEVIQAELMNQLQSQTVQQHLPCFDWDNTRFQEKWDNIVRSLLLQVSLPNFIWEQWIQEIQENSSAKDYLFQVLGSENQEITPENILTAEVYFETNNTLEDLPEESPIEPEPEKIVVEEIIIPTPEVKATVIEEKIIPEPITEAKKEPEANLNHIQPAAGIVIENVQTSIKTPSADNFFQEENTEAKVSPKKIIEVIADSSSEKVYEKLQGTDSSLKSLVETKMTETLANSISLNQKIKFIQSIFDGEGHHLNQLIEYIDQEASGASWQATIEQRYSHFQRADNEEAWEELLEMIRRKFN
ncbi:hypothetical protein [Aquirufa rosea]|uniref:Uncharacterized protein n=1 Tax=Aquirufa rosea TaxID=2509241 RepID=A0A4Q1BXK9_9BACT|nr:hypothetical protein [Aquirufa rosea]RXK47138.1 hypothetical protein ESB04_11100 [Aquirufa rosea]